MAQAWKDRLYRLLRWSERYTRTDMVYLAHGGFWLLSAQTVSTASSIILAIAFANLLPKEAYGLYKYALSIATLFSIFTLPGVTTALTRSAARNLDGALRTATASRIRWSLIGSAIGLLAAGYYLIHSNASLAGILLIIGLFLPVFDTFSNYAAYLQGKRRFKEFTYTNTAIQLATTIALIGALLLWKDALVLVCVYFGSYALLRFYFFRRILRGIPAGAADDPEAVPYGKHLSLMGVLSTVASNIDNIVLFHFIGAAEVALYTIATAAPDQLKALLGYLNTLFFPSFANGDEVRLRMEMRNLFMLYSLVTAAAIGTYIILAPLLFRLLFPQYVSMVFASQLFAASLIIICIEPAYLFLSARGMVREQYWVITVSSVFQIASVVIGAIMAGVMGVIIARLASRLLGSVMNLSFYLWPMRRSSDARQELR